MLARSFMTAKDLGIPRRQRDVLIALLGALERGDVRRDEFDMGERCGTACCLAGHAETMAPGSFFHPNGYLRFFNSGRLMDLFLAQGRTQECLSDVTMDQATTALANYLTTGDPKWREATSA